MLNKQKYVAIGISNFNDVKDSIKIFNSENQTTARNYIINHFDCSLVWTFTETKNYQGG